MLTISQNEILDRFEFDNPWWTPGSGIEKRFAELPRRFYFSPFLALIQDRSVNRAVVVMGPRRVGKTVMVFHAIQALLDAGISGQSIFYISIETPLYTGIPLEKMLGMFQKRFEHKKDESLFIFFDEVQYLRDWEIHLKSLVDSYPSYSFVVTGSAAAALKLKSQESGAGRFTDFILPPLTFSEYLNFINRENELIEKIEISKTRSGSINYRALNIDELNKEFCNYLNFGGYPEAVMSKVIQADPGRYIKSDIIDKVLLRDLPSLYGISDVQELNRLFTTLAYNTGNEITLEGLSMSAGVAKNTIKRYLEYLEAAFLIRRVHRIDQNARHFKRAIKFKVYLTNPSMRSALFGHIEEDSVAIGHLVETAIYSQWLHSPSIDNLYYARWGAGEVDIVYVEQDTQKPTWIVEVKWTDRAVSNHSELDNCAEFIGNTIKNAKRALVTTKTVSEQITYNGVDFEFIPSSTYAYTVGANILDREGKKRVPT
ncbi:MAG: ATP-binding protein [Gallionellaceae bacterium]|nr:ATP-binding protein [Gallionellaceae bacterium]